jgi:2-iminoacetate synthase ThiH
MTVAYKISLKAAVVSDSAETMAESIAAVAEHLDDIQQHTPRFLGFTLSSDRAKRTALFNMYVNEDDPVDAVSAAYAWAATAINAAGDGTREWTMYTHPEEREQVPA